MASHEANIQDRDVLQPSLRYPLKAGCCLLQRLSQRKSEQPHAVLAQPRYAVSLQ